MKRDRILRLARLDPNWPAQFTTAKHQFDFVAIVDLFSFRELWTNEHGIFPGQFREWAWKFLQPAVIHVAAIENARISAEENLQLRR